MSTTASDQQQQKEQNPVRSPVPIDCNFDETTRSNGTNSILPVGEELQVGEITPSLTTPLGGPSSASGGNNNNNTTLSGGNRWGSGFLDRNQLNPNASTGTSAPPALPLDRKDSMTIGTLLRKQSFGGLSQGVATTTGATHGSNSTTMRPDLSAPSAPLSSRNNNNNNVPAAGSRYGSFNFGTTATNPQSVSPPSLSFGNQHHPQTQQQHGSFFQLNSSPSHHHGGQHQQAHSPAGFSFAPSPDPAIFYRVRNTTIPATPHSTLVEVMQHLLDDYPALAPNVRRMIAASQASSQAFLSRANLNEAQVQYESMVSNFSQNVNNNINSSPSHNNNNSATRNHNNNNNGSPVHFVNNAAASGTHHHSHHHHGNNNNNKGGSSSLVRQNSKSPQSLQNTHNHGSSARFNNHHNNNSNNNRNNHNNNQNSKKKKENGSDEDNIRDDVSNTTPSSVSLGLPSHQHSGTGLRSSSNGNNNNNNNNNNSKNNNNNSNSTSGASAGGVALLPTPPMALDGIADLGMTVQSLCSTVNNNNNQN